MQGVFGVGTGTRKRSSYGYQTVTTVTTVTDDRRGTQETEVLKTVVGGASSQSPGPGPRHGATTGNGNRNWRSLDGPLVPQPDLVQHSQTCDRENGGSNPPGS